MWQILVDLSCINMEIKLFSLQKWPDDVLPEFKKSVMALSADFCELSHRCLELCAIGFDFEV